MTLRSTVVKNDVCASPVRFRKGNACDDGPRGDGRKEKEFAINVCKQIFGLRYGEISLDKSGTAWTPWFYDIAWDLTIVLFDKRLRRMWLFAITDTAHRDQARRRTFPVPTSKSAEIPSFARTRRTIASVNPRFPVITSETRARLPISGSRSLRVSPCCSIRN